MELVNHEPFLTNLLSRVFSSGSDHTTIQINTKKDLFWFYFGDAALGLRGIFFEENVTICFEYVTFPYKKTITD